MKAEILIQDYRETHLKLQELHLKSIQTQGQAGMVCRNYDELLTQINLTDEEILNKLEEKGFVIVDKIEYLQSKKEKE